ncbi:hypothetical protein GCM10011529_19340 [Polymorphobacter glacialis]|uniref:NAD(P)-binding domain-containing protein n=1 Tax=Sandarakinorhabdus glacialis TaxID=1614636 RepID=A0A916ZTG4_9SPHN|nr:GDP-mannose 4,6-dehydratase [Polymorphobacter glacialis]GGE13077.1 hypothetical protein GCM10011529_19340 [Polymorphobacter glacialis]
MTNALVLGADGPVGAYLSRLLQARGTAVFGTLENGSGALAALGSLGDVNIVPAFDAVRVAGELPQVTIYAINDGNPDQAALVAEVLAATPTTRLAHVVDAAVLRHSPALLAQARQVGDWRRDDGRNAVNAVLHAHDSRLGPRDTLPAIITDAAWRASKGEAVPPLELLETGPRDWGWTPEYVDAIARLTAMPRPLDLAIGSGHPLTTADFVRDAFAFFRLDPGPYVTIVPRPEAPPETPVDTARLKTATGWSASTWGRDLVRALSEGAAARAS